MDYLQGYQLVKNSLRPLTISTSVASANTWSRARILPGSLLYWPVFLILIGFYVIKSALWRSSGKPPASGDYINLSFVLGGGDFRFNTQNLKGGKVDAIMGGGTIDLRDADFKEDEVFFESFVLWGGVEIRVPEHWQVNVQGSPLLGGMENKATYVESGKPPKKFTIKATTIMGGVEIKN